MPQFWIAIFFIFLAVAELYQSIKGIDLPLPVYLGLGTILAIASNYDRQFLFDAAVVVGGAATVPNDKLTPTVAATPAENPASTSLQPIDPALVLSSIQTPLLAAIQSQDVD